MFQKITLLALVAMFSNLVACTSISDTNTESQELTLAPTEPFDPFGELEEEGTAYPWISSDENVETDSSVVAEDVPQAKAQTRSMTKASQKTSKKSKKKK